VPFKGSLFAHSITSIRIVISLIKTTTIHLRLVVVAHDLGILMLAALKWRIACVKIWLT
jgi:hypothetical protein